MKINIEGREFEAFDGDTILDVARRNNIQIPTICFLSGCSPTLACKMCMVEVNGKRAYSCNAKVKDGMEVVVHNDELQKDRNEIMTSYCVNHPLECGVCDKSGECELQDFTLYTKVDFQQFGLQEADKKPFSFAQSFYDPALCIMCERCVTTCKDNIGAANLKAGKAALFTPDNYKDSMGKDPYSVWAKRQKGLIEFVGKNECKDCGECISVCPVGAMTYKDFTYTSNAWELEKIHTTCGYCAGGCELIHNVKHLDVKGDLQKVYRVQNDYLYNPICGAGRFAFDNVSVGSRDLTEVLRAFNRADSIYIGSDVSNEEAMIADYIAKKLNIPLINHESWCWQIFQERFIYARGHYAKQFSGNKDSVISDYFATFNDFKTSESFISLHTYFKYDAPIVRYKINNNLKIQKNSQVISIGLFHDNMLESLGKNITQIKGGSLNVALAGILGLVFANDLIDDFELCFPNSLQSFLAEGLKVQGFVLQKEGLDEDKDSILQESKALEQGLETQELGEQELKEDSKASKDSQIGQDPNNIKADNLSSYNIESIVKSLGLEDLSSLKLTKSNGILMISPYVFEEFLTHDFTSSEGYGLQSYHTAGNPPTIEHAVATAIMEGITESVQDDIMDNAVKLQILSHLIAFLCEKLSLKILYIPKGTNTLGVANLCTLARQDSIESKYSIGIRTHGNFILDSNLSTIKPHFPLPTLAQSDGSVTNMEMRVLPLFSTLPYLDSFLESALDLCDVARELEALPESLTNLEYLGDFTSYLFYRSALYQNILHRDLRANFERDGSDNRGYFLNLNEFYNKHGDMRHGDMDMKFSIRLRPDVFHNALLLEAEQQFNLTTLASGNLQTKIGVYASPEFLKQHDLDDGASIKLVSGESNVSAIIYCDNDIADSILLVSPLLPDVRGLFDNYFSVSLDIVKAADKIFERNLA